MNELLLYAQADQLNEATSHYIGTIAQAASQLGLQFRHVKRLADVPWRAQVLVVECKSAFKLRLARPRARLWLWMQGVYPEEARMQFDSRGRERLQNLFERTALRHAQGVLMVSQAMQEHFARKYPGLAVPSFVMPCANASLQAQAFLHEGKYGRPRFVYAGSLHTWQCFDLTLDVFRRVQAACPEARLSIFTGSQEAARRAVEAAGLRDVEIAFVPLEQLQDRLAAFKYGFVLRRPHVVNRVATPTKVSSYMAAGVIPILTKAVHDYAKRLGATRPLVMTQSCEPAAIAEAILRMEGQPLQAEQVLRSYREVFDGYFEHRRYLPALSVFLDQAGLRVP